jgi:hypothetical protein
MPKAGMLLALPAAKNATRMARIPPALLTDRTTTDGLGLNALQRPFKPREASGREAGCACGAGN